MSGAELEGPIQRERVAEPGKVGVCIVDKNLDILYANTCAAEMLGCSVVEMHGGTTSVRSKPGEEVPSQFVYQLIRLTQQKSLNQKKKLHT